MPTNNIEIEAKILLSKNDYDLVLEEMNFTSPEVTQTNYYLDSQEQVLKKYGMILRLRLEDDRYVFTMKAPLSEGLLEKNQVLHENEAKMLIKQNIIPRGEISNFLEMLQINPESMIVLATLTTVRQEMEYEGAKLDISKNTYGNHVDYEMECDSYSKERSQEILASLCNKMGITYQPNHLSKEQRAIAANLKK